MPILNDILGHEVLGREYKKWRVDDPSPPDSEAVQFCSEWAEHRLAKLSAKELEELSVRVHDAKSIESLLK